MSGAPSLTGSPLVASPLVQAVFALLVKEGEEARIAGGAVRDALLGRPLGDIDFATTALPQTVQRLAAEAGVKSVPTGIEHGTVTLVVEDRPFEVTTLREDVETDGRRAVVRFGRDWEADARRRDFTLNALMVGRDGQVFDPVGGYEDLIARRIRFIGEADRRIAEDRLRLLRFFRFNAVLGEGPLDVEGLSACIRARHGLRELSAERIGQEMLKLVVGGRAAPIAWAMQESGVLPLLLAGVAELPAFSRLPEVEQALGPDPAAAIRLAVLACRIGEDVERLAERLRLSGAMRKRIGDALAASRSVAEAATERQRRRALYRHGPAAFRDGVVTAAARGWLAPESWAALHGLPERAAIPEFPLSGRDVTSLGVAAGPAVGGMLRQIEQWWIAEDFRPTADELRRRLQEMVQAGQ